MFARGPPPGFVGGSKKNPIMKKNVHEFNKHKLHQFFKTKDFSRKIAFLYYPVVPSYTEAANGRFPVFKISKTTVMPSNKVKPGTASTGSIRNTNSMKQTNHVKHVSVPTTSNNPIS